MRRSSSSHTDAPQASETDQDARSPGTESEVWVALGAAFLGTLVLGQLVGARSHWELLLLLALVAALAFLFENLASRRSHKHDRRPDGG